MYFFYFCTDFLHECLDETRLALLMCILAHVKYYSTFAIFSRASARQNNAFKNPSCLVDQRIHKNNSTFVSFHSTFEWFSAYEVVCSAYESCNSAFNIMGLMSQNNEFLSYEMNKL